MIYNQYFVLTIGIFAVSFFLFTGSIGGLLSKPFKKDLDLSLALFFLSLWLFFAAFSLLEKSRELIIPSFFLSLFNYILSVIFLYRHHLKIIKGYISRSLRNTAVFSIFILCLAFSVLYPFIFRLSLHSSDYATLYYELPFFYEGLCMFLPSAVFYLEMGLNLFHNYKKLCRSGGSPNPETMVIFYIAYIANIIQFLFWILDRIFSLHLVYHLCFISGFFPIIGFFLLMIFPDLLIQPGNNDVDQIDKKTKDILPEEDTKLLFRIKTLTEEKKELARAYQKMEEIALIDSLTGLYNRRAMFIKLEDEISRFKRSGNIFCLILCDVDNFKLINDNYGHDAGDFILKKLSCIMKNNLRQEDHICRWGGEEFLICINNADREKGGIIAEKIRKAIETEVFKFHRLIINVTMTFGISEYSRDIQINDLIRKADQNLYAGKRSSKNCVVF